MEGLAPPLALLSRVKRSIEKGESIKLGLMDYLKNTNDEFSNFVTQWLANIQQGQDTKALLRSCSSIHRRYLLEVLERGLRGESVHSSLLRLEIEIIEACEEEISTKLARLPFIMMVPLLLFQFPAFLALLFGPLLKNFFHSFGGG